MLNKKTVLFFTDRYNTEVAENVKKEFGFDGSVIGIIITKKELENQAINSIIDKVVPEETGFRYLIRNKRTAMATLKSNRIPSQKVIFNPRNAIQRRIYNALNRYNPGVVAVTAHTVLADCLAAIDKYGKEVKVVVIGEEFVLDKRLIQRSVDYYFVDNYSMRNALSEGGIPDDRIEIASLPIARVFFEKNDREEALKKFVLDADKPTVLISASVVGDSRFKKVVEAIKEADFDANFVVACGKNRNFINAARDLGFTAYNEGIDMNAALNACDLLVARPTTMLMGEAIVKGKKVFALLPNGKTESANLDYLSLDAVTKIKDIPTLIESMRDFLGGFVGKKSEQELSLSGNQESVSESSTIDDLVALQAKEETARETFAVEEIVKIATIDETSAKRIATKILELAVPGVAIE